MLVGVAIALVEGRTLPPDLGFPLLILALFYAVVALLGFVVMSGFFNLRRWARYVLMATALLGIGLCLFQGTRAGSARLDALLVLLALSGLAFAVSVAPGVRRTMSE